MLKTDQNTRECEAVAQRLYELYSTPQSEYLLTELLRETRGLLLGDCRAGCTSREHLNEFILRYYPNEMAIKSSFVDNVLLKQGSSNVTVFELPIGSSRVDLCKINGCSSAYEIKTDLDSFYRLEKQLSDYCEVFENVYVITSEKRWESLPEYVPESCGIYSYRQKKDGRYSFILRRAPIRNCKLNPLKQLMVIPKGALKSEFDVAKSLDKEEVAHECLLRYSAEDINRFFKRYIKMKYRKRWDYFKTQNESIFEIDYEWFFHNNLDPAIVY